LVGISSIHEYIEGQTPTPTPTPQPGQLPTKFVDIDGRISFVTMNAGASCNAFVRVSGDSTRLGLPGGTIIRLSAADHNICTSFGLAKMGNADITFDITRASESQSAQAQRLFIATRVTI
jgi:hypothetical protein